MHSGFGALRKHYGMNIEASLPEVGARLLAEHADLRKDLERIHELWRTALAESGGPFLFGAYSIADAYFAPVAMRLRTYAPPLPPEVAAYVARLSATKGVAAWIRDALEEKDFIQFDEPYRTGRD
jgi:glutathione S-transferase